MIMKNVIRKWTVLGLVAGILVVSGCHSGMKEPTENLETRTQQEHASAQSQGEEPEQDLPEGQIRLYKPEELLAGATEPYLTVAVPADAADHVITIDEDRGVAVLYPSAWTGSSDIYLLDLTEGTLSKLPGPEPQGWYAYAGWHTDGRMLLVGRHVWIGDPSGKQFVAVAETDLTWSVSPSPSGRYLALWGPNERGEYTLVDLQTSEAQTRTGPFRRCAQDGAVMLSWSPDERYLAGIDCDSDATAEGARTRIIDPFSGEPVQTLEGKPIVAWLPDGRLLTQSGIRSVSMVVVDLQGRVIEEMDGYVHPSPDGRFLIQDHFLVNVATGERVPLKISGTLLWTKHSNIYVVKRPQS